MARQVWWRSRRCCLISSLRLIYTRTTFVKLVCLWSHDASSSPLCSFASERLEHFWTEACLNCHRSLSRPNSSCVLSLSLVLSLVPVPNHRHSRTFKDSTMRCEGGWSRACLENNLIEAGRSIANSAGSNSNEPHATKTPSVRGFFHSGFRMSAIVRAPDFTYLMTSRWSALSSNSGRKRNSCMWWWSSLLRDLVIMRQKQSFQE